MPSVFRLAYVDLTTAAMDAAVTYYRDIIGASEVERSGGSAYLSLGLDHHTIALHRADRPTLGAIGLQIAADASLQSLAARLRDMGLSPEEKQDARPGVPTLLEVRGVGGHTFQLFPEMSLSGTGFSGTGIEPVRLGHVAVLSTDPKRLLAFLQDGLGFWKTDSIEDLVTFVTCNRDHHVLNVVEAPIATLHHVAFQLTGRDHQFSAADFLAQRHVPTLWGPARHTAGHNIASYHYGADGALIELYNDMDVFLPDLGYCEPRPWHGDLPQRPKKWQISEMTRWGTRYEFDFATIAFGQPS